MSQIPRVPRSQGPKDQDISNSHSNMSLTLKKVHLVNIIIETLAVKTENYFFCECFYSRTMKLDCCKS